jgi:hypothetical protein
VSITEHLGPLSRRWISGLFVLLGLLNQGLVGLPTHKAVNFLPAGVKDGEVWYATSLKVLFVFRERRRCTLVHINMDDSEGTF